MPLSFCHYKGLQWNSFSVYLSYAKICDGWGGHNTIRDDLSVKLNSLIDYNSAHSLWLWKYSVVFVDGPMTITVWCSYL